MLTKKSKPIIILTALPDKLVREEECKVFIKTSSARQKAAVDCIQKNHPYDVPEITVLGAKGDIVMDKAYWSWLTNYVGS